MSHIWLKVLFLFKCAIFGEMCYFGSNFHFKFWKAQFFQVPKIVIECDQNEMCPFWNVLFLEPDQNGMCSLQKSSQKHLISEKKIINYIMFTPNLYLRYMEKAHINMY